MKIETCNASSPGMGGRPVERRAFFTAAFVGLCTIAGTGVATAEDHVGFGAYDPHGGFATDRSLRIEHIFVPWDGVHLPSLLEAGAYAFERDRELLVTVEPWSWNGNSVLDPQALQAGILAGSYDGNMREICRVLGSLDKPVTVRWAHEMDGMNGHFPWSLWEPQAYIDSYRRMVGICRDVAPDTIFMWSPMGEEGLEDYYPGDDVVDLVGLSVFGLQGWERLVLGEERSYVEVLEPRYRRVEGFGLPVVVAELGYAGDPAYVADWESSSRLAYAQFPLLTDVVYFNRKEVHPWPDEFGLPDWEAHLPDQGLTQ